MPKWFEQILENPKYFDKVSDQILIELKDEAKKIMDSETANYNIKNSKINTDYRWMKTVMIKGTVSDKIAAYTVLIQDNPVYNLDTIRNAIGMVKVGKKKECIAVIETLSELFLSDLLRPNAKLCSFYDQPLSQLSELSSGNAITRRKYLSYWYFEDQLKEAYNTFVKALNTAAHDSVDSNKEKAIAAMCNLLAGNPEQEKNLLSHVINKMGDPSHKVASKTMYCLTQLLKQHSNMQGVVLKEIEKLLFRSNIGHKAQYYSLCFISQFFLSSDNPGVARKLIEVYFSFFKQCVKDDDVDSRMMSALLIGVNRAFPYAKLQLKNISEHVDTMYRVVQVANFNVALNALGLLFQVSQCADSVNDRFYSALYRKLLDPKLPSCVNEAIFLNLLYKAMKRDEMVERVIAFIKRLLQIAMNVQSHFACGIIYLISQLLSNRSGINILQLKPPETEIKFEDDDEEEKYTDIKDDYDQEAHENNDVNNKDETKEGSALGWLHRANFANNNKQQFKHKQKNYYDPMARNPLYAKAHLSANMELLMLMNHYHPSVRLFTENLMDGKKIEYSGDPLKDFTLIHFLERFVFKNPKKSEELPCASTFSKRKYYQPPGTRALAVFSNDFLMQSERNIPVDELFLHSYMQQRYKDRKINDVDADDSDLESVGSEEFEDMLSKMSQVKEFSDEEDIDFMHEVGENMKHKSVQSKRKYSSDDDGDSLSEGEHETDLSDENDISDNDDLEMGNNEELLHDLSDEDEEELLFDDDDEDDIMLDTGTKSKPKQKKSGNGGVFASAEEFASLLEDEGSSKIAPGSSNQMANMDAAGAKQLDWENKRNRWIKGYNSVIGKRNIRGKKHIKQFALSSRQKKKHKTEY